MHNRYRSALPSGENVVIDNETTMLRQAGVEVETYMRENDEVHGLGLLEKAALCARPTFSLEDARRFGAKIDSHRPDVVHLHNVFPLISPWVVRVAKKAGVPVVQTVHNYRHVCASGTFFRDGRSCRDCCGKSLPWPGVLHGCYRGSKSQTVAMATALASHRSTWQLVDRFLAVSEFVAEHLRRAGVASERIVVKPNAVPDPGTPGPPGAGFLFGGRLEPEKGIGLLIEAWAHSGLGRHEVLAVVGDGSERAAVEQAAATVPGLRFHGLVDGAEMARRTADAAVVVVPSLWDEPCPLMVVEAFSAGRPAIVTKLGALGEMVDGTVGWSAAPDVASLAAALVAAHCGDRLRRGAKARQRYVERFHPQVVTPQLILAYEAARGARVS